MSNPGQDLTLSFDDILGAVKETARGRWFVESLETRIRVGNTSRILDAVARLEDRIEQLSHNSEDAVLVRKAREAIAAARRDIARLENKEGLSTEAQLFAQLAKQAKDAFGGKGIARALTLVDDLDREFTPHSAEAPAAMSAPPPPAAALFQADEAIFEAAPTVQAAPAPTPAPETPKESGAPRGAKVMIHKLGVAAPEVPAKEEPAPAPTAEAEPAHSRIHVTRRQPGEESDVPLLEEAPAA